jgi:ABC-type oligopeptide transport system substrate-binding subunit
LGAEAQVNRKALGVLSGIMVLVLLMTGCGSSGSQGNATKQEVRLDILTEPPTLDPSKAADTTSGWILDQIMEGLTYLDAENKIHPGIAASWDVTKD